MKFLSTQQKKSISILIYQYRGEQKDSAKGNKKVKLFNSSAKQELSLRI